MFNKEGQPWDGNVGFEPVSFLVTIKKLKADFAQLAELIFLANNELRATRRKAARGENVSIHKFKTVKPKNRVFPTLISRLFSTRPIDTSPNDPCRYRDRHSEPTK